MIEGGCFCGSVRYRVWGAPSHETNCHCSICRRTSAAPFVTWFTVPAADFEFAFGEPTSFRSSHHGIRKFCRGCGTPLTFSSSRSPEEVDITTCSLDHPEQLPPKDHTQTRSKLPWVELGDGLPSFPRARTSR